jgi:hypothetical protein
MYTVTCAARSLCFLRSITVTATVKVMVTVTVKVMVTITVKVMVTITVKVMVTVTVKVVVTVTVMYLWAFRGLQFYWAGWASQVQTPCMPHGC